MSPLLSPRPAKPYRKRAADILEEFIDSFPGEKVKLSDLMSAIGSRAYAVAIFVFALANLLIANIPGISTVLGLPIVIFGLQMMTGQERPWLPKRLAEREFKRETFTKMIRRAVSVLRKVEFYIRPRLIFLAHKNGRFLGFIIFVLGVVLALPVLFGNWLPAWGLAFIALGMLERDGLVTFIGFVFGALGAAYAVAFYSGFAYIFDWLVR